MFRTVVPSRMTLEFGDFPSFPTASGVNGACDDTGNGASSYCFCDDSGGSSFFDIYQKRTQPTETKKGKGKMYNDCNKTPKNVDVLEHSRGETSAELEMNSLKPQKKKQNKFLAKFHKYTPTSRRKTDSSAIETSFNDSVVQDFVNLNI